MTRLALTDAQKAALAALHAAGDAGLSWEATGTCGKALKGYTRASMWALGRKGLASWWLKDERFRITEEGARLAPLVRAHD